MRFRTLILACTPLAFVACEKQTTSSTTLSDAVELVATPAPDPKQSVIRINSTRQRWAPGQPWEKQPPRKRRSLAAIVAPGQALTTAEMVADATMLELESIDGRKLAQGKVIAVDYEANLALLGLADSESESDFFDSLEPLEIAEPVGLGTIVDAIQVEENGSLLVTSGPVQSIDVVANFLPGQYFLTYEVKASMQSAASSFSVPALHQGKLAGLLTSYSSKDQLSDITCTEIVARFLKDAADGEYQGFPSLGVHTTRTEDSGFRAWLNLPEDGGGIYVAKVRKDGAAKKAGLEKGDVIIVIDGNEIDRLGYFEHPVYGRTYWSHLIRGAKAVGEEVKLGVLRQGEALEITAIPERRNRSQDLVPKYTFGEAPNFLVKGGLIFQELSLPLLESFGDEWRSRAPLDLLNAFENPEIYEKRGDRVVFLAGVIATPATVGYEQLRNLIVTDVNGTPIPNVKALIEAFNEVPEDGLHKIKFDDKDFDVHLDEVLSNAVDGQLLQRGLSKLSRAE